MKRGEVYWVATLANGAKIGVAASTASEAEKSVMRTETGKRAGGVRSIARISRPKYLKTGGW